MGKPRHRVLNAVENISWDTRWLYFWKQNAQAGTKFSNVTWQQPTTPCVHSPPRGIGQMAHQQQDKTVQMVPNMVHRRLLGCTQAGNVSRRLDRLEWTAGYLRNTLGYWIIRHGGAANLITALPSARAPRCLLCSLVSRALMVCDTLRVGNSNDTFYVPMSRVRLKL